jgi:hypothetical protein
VEDADNDDEEEELDEDVMEDDGTIELVVVMEDNAPVTDIVADVNNAALNVVTGTVIVVIAVAKASVAVTIGDAVVAEMLNPRCVEAPRL